MSEFFVYTFNQNNPCAHCKTSALVVGKRTYSLCRTHLTAARDRWRVWAAERRAAGACISCHRKSFNGWLRCRKHREENRLKCQRWGKENPGYSARAWAKRKLILATGTCICKAHNPLPPGFNRCDDCRTKNRVYRPEPKHKPAPGRRSFGRNSL